MPEEKNNFNPFQGETQKEIFEINNFHRRIQVVPSTNRAVSTKHFLKLSPDFYISGVLKADATVVSVDGDPGTEATLNSYTIPLNMISRNYTGSGTSGKEFRNAGNAFRIRASGRYTCNAGTETVALALKVGSTTYHTLTSTAAITVNAPWIIDWTIIVATIGSSGTAESFVSAKINNVNKDAASTTTKTIYTTSAQTISITATWTGGDASDDLSIRTFLIELIN